MEHSTARARSPKKREWATTTTATDDTHRREGGSFFSLEEDSHHSRSKRQETAETAETFSTRSLMNDDLTHQSSDSMSSSLHTRINFESSSATLSQEKNEEYEETKDVSGAIVTRSPIKAGIEGSSSKTLAPFESNSGSFRRPASHPSLLHTPSPPRSSSPLSRLQRSESASSSSFTNSIEESKGNQSVVNDSDHSNTVEAAAAPSSPPLTSFVGSRGSSFTALSAASPHKLRPLIPSAASSSPSLSLLCAPSPLQRSASNASPPPSSASLTSLSGLAAKSPTLHIAKSLSSFSLSSYHTTALFTPTEEEFTERSLWEEKTREQHENTLFSFLQERLSSCHTPLPVDLSLSAEGEEQDPDEKSKEKFTETAKQESPRLGKKAVDVSGEMVSQKSSVPSPNSLAAVVSRENQRKQEEDIVNKIHYGNSLAVEKKKFESETGKQDVSTSEIHSEYKATAVTDEQLEESLFLLGAGIYDITGPAAEAGMFGYAQAHHVTRGIHMRLRARAFIFADAHQPEKRFVYVCADLGQISEAVAFTVLDMLQQDAELSGVYNHENVMISCTHTHCSPGGLSTYTLYNLHPPLTGFDHQNFNCVSEGILTAIRRAHGNLSPGYVRMAVGPCLGASVNRSPEAYVANPKEERDKYEHDTDKDMYLLRLDGRDGSPIGMLNWFAVHPTSVGANYPLITGDNKGYAAYVFERLQGVRHLTDAPKSFVAAFAQANEGDVSPNIHGPRHLVGDDDDYDRMFLVGERQLSVALALYEKAAEAPPLSPRNLQARYAFVDFPKLKLKPEWKLDPNGSDSLSSAVLGLSMASGTHFDGKGITFVKEGLKSTDRSTWVNAVLPQLKVEHKEKCCFAPVGLMGFSPQVLKLQVAVIGSLAIAGLPFEPSTMSGRRVRETVLATLKDIGVERVSISGLSNGYAGYLTTREEYAVQRYEGASTHFGPNQLYGVQQVMEELAEAIAKDCTIHPGPSIDWQKKKEKARDFSAGVILDGVGAKFGEVFEDVEPRYVAGRDVACAEFVGGHPKNNLRTQNTFLEIQRKKKKSEDDPVESSGNRGDDEEEDEWVSVLDDGDEYTIYRWRRDGITHSIVTIEWEIPADTEPGIYRIKHIGDYKATWSRKIIEYEGFSSEFEVLPPSAASPSKQLTRENSHRQGWNGYLRS